MNKSERNQHIPHQLLLKWLIFSGVVCFAITVAWQEQIMSSLFATDKSRISWAIMLIYALLTLHCARQVCLLSTEMNRLENISGMIKNSESLEITISKDQQIISNHQPLPDCRASQYIHDLYCSLGKNPEDTQTQDLIDVYKLHLKKPQEIGWFVSDVILKLGLLGTIVGFIFMLGSISNIVDFDVSTIQKILRHMSNGMSIALYTTLTGLIFSILASIQYYMLDQQAEDIIAKTQRLTHVHLLPKFKRLQNTK